MTEKENILAMRKGYMAALARCGAAPLMRGYVSYHAEAAERFPLPPISSPRLEDDPHDPALQWCARVRFDTESADHPRRLCVRFTRGGNAAWNTYPEGCVHLRPTVARVALWADLLATPDRSIPDPEDDNG